MPPQARLRIVTAANEPYWRCTWQLLRCLERLGLQPSIEVIVYDLGMNAGRAVIERRFPWARLRRFDFSAHPAHVACRSNFAWKPIAVLEVLRELAGDVLWLDSASLLHEPLTEIHGRVRRQPVLTLSGQTSLAENCHPDVLSALAVPGPVRDAAVQIGGVVGFRIDSEVARAVAEEWCALALRPELASHGPRSPRHTYDQALLSIAVQRRVLAGTLVLAGGDIDISAARPVRWISSRNKVSPRVPCWMDALARSAYWVYKRADQWLWRARKFKAGPVNGLHRWPKENFRVFIRDERAVTSVTAPRWSYYADPFLVRTGSQSSLFVEEFLHREHRGRLVAIPLDEMGRLMSPVPLELQGGPRGHLSFPLVFEHEGALFLLPESSANRSVDLYACDVFPVRWRWRQRLLDNIDAVDSTLLRHAGRWWLFTFAREAGRSARSLHIFYAEELSSATWEAHPVNRENRHAAEPFQSGRGGGAFMRTLDGVVLRPVQCSHRYYGEGVRFMQIDALTPEVFRESEYRGTHPATDLAHELPVHHVAACGDSLVWDVRTRVSYGQHLPVLRRWALTPDCRIDRLKSPNGRERNAGRSSFRAVPPGRSD